MPRPLVAVARQTPILTVGPSTARPAALLSYDSSMKYSANTL